jgi:hypothetical protein
MAPDSAGADRLLVVQGWGRQRMAVPVDDVVEVVPGGRRLVITCRTGHRPPQVDHAPVGIIGSLMGRLGGRRPGPARRR